MSCQLRLVRVTSGHFVQDEEEIQSSNKDFASNEPVWPSGKALGW